MRSFVLRVASLFGGPRPKSSVDRVLDGLKRGREVRVFTDRTVSPTYVPDLVALVGRLLDGAAPPGLYHAANDGFTTWQGLAEEAARLRRRAAPRSDPAESRAGSSPAPVRARPGAPSRPRPRPARLARLAEEGAPRGGVKRRDS
jgi:dTDP-4-dehydrorhamnose reductase